MEWLKEILPDAGRVVTDGIEERYLSDTLGRLRGRAAALVFAESTEEVSGILREAHRRGVPVTPRGAGTNLVGSTVPADGGIVLDFTRMNRILELDRDTMTVTVEPGILLEDLQRYVENEGLFYPPDPGERPPQSAATSARTRAACARSSTASRAIMCGGSRSCSRTAP